jgi:hypothetical protein
MKQILILSAIMVVASCSQKIENAQLAASSSEETELQKHLVKEYNLPPEPDVEENNSTINGVDINNNLIRDDWERAIVFEHHEDQLLINLNQEYAKLNYKLNSLYDSKKFKELRASEPKIRELIGCAFYFGKDGLGSDNLDRMPVSTYERYVYQQQRDSEMLKGLGGVSGFDTLMLSKICQKYRLETVNAKNLSKKEIEEKFNLPPEPSEEDTLATLEGVDLDEDGIRDDLKRLITFEFPNDPYARKVYERRAAIWTELLKNEGNLEKQQELIKENGMIIICQRRGYIPTTKKIDSLGDYITIGANRGIYEQKLIKKLSFSIPSAAESKQYCESFK